MSIIDGFRLPGVGAVEVVVEEEEGDDGFDSDETEFSEPDVFAPVLRRKRIIRRVSAVSGKVIRVEVAEADSSTPD